VESDLTVKSTFISSI